MKIELPQHNHEWLQSLSEDRGESVDHLLSRLVSIVHLFDSSAISEDDLAFLSCQFLTVK